MIPACASATSRWGLGRSCKESQVWEGSQRHPVPGKLQGERRHRVCQWGGPVQERGPYASKDPLVSFNNLSGHFLLVSLTLTLNYILGEYL